MIQPLRGVHVVEFEGLGLGPLAGHLLAGMGAQVTLVARPVASPVQARFDGPPGGGAGEFERLKTRVVVDLKQPAGRDEALALVARADALVEGLRPGVMERLGLGPADCARVQPRIVYGRMTGWGQDGPLARSAGHDLNYVALSGMLSFAARPGQPPVAAPTVTGDAAGALGLAFGIACALVQVRAGGPGCVIDAAVVDIAAMMGLIAQWVAASGQLGGPTPSPFHDSPFYDVYACADGGFVTVGALEPAFYAELLRRLGLDDVDPAAQYDAAQWPALKQRFADTFRQRGRAEWCALLEGTDACFAPVLSLAEALHHPHNAARELYTARGSGVYAGVAPRFAPLPKPADQVAD